MADPLVERIARRQADARERARKLRASIPRAADVLRAHGARRVRLFGSLATGAEPHAETDIDLAVEGMSDSEMGEAVFELEALFGSRVDVVAIERASPRVAEWIARDGRDV